MKAWESIVDGYKLRWHCACIVIWMVMQTQMNARWFVNG